jgi:hypothetical protein
MQECHAHIRNIQICLVPQDGQENFRSEPTNRRHTISYHWSTKLGLPRYRSVAYKVGSNDVSTHSYDNSVSD